MLKSADDSRGTWWRLTWLAMIAFALALGLLVSPATRADGGGAEVPTSCDDTTFAIVDTTGLPPTTSVCPDTGTPTVTTLLLELWGLLI